MSIDIIEFLKLDDYINNNYDNMSQKEYEKHIKELEELKRKILGE